MGRSSDPRNLKLPSFRFPLRFSIKTYLRLNMETLFTRSLETLLCRTTETRFRLSNSFTETSIGLFRLLYRFWLLSIYFHLLFYSLKKTPFIYSMKILLHVVRVQVGYRGTFGVRLLRLSSARLQRTFPKFIYLDSFQSWSRNTLFTPPIQTFCSPVEINSGPRVENNSGIF